MRSMLEGSMFLKSVILVELTEIEKKAWQISVNSSIPYHGEYRNK